MNQKTQTKRPFPYVALCLILVVVLVAAVLVYSLLDSTGVVGKMDTAAKSDNFKVSGNELKVYEYQVGLSQLATEYWYYKYGLMTDSTGLSSLYSSDYEYAYALLPMYVGTGAFSEQAYAYAQQYLTYCEGALEAGVALEDEDYEELETYMENLEDMAKSSDISMRSFINSYIGKGVSEKEIRSAMEKYFLGVKYAEKLEEDFSDAVTEDEMKEYLENNKSSFYTSKYFSYVLVNESLQEKAKECDTVEEIKGILVDYMVENKFESLYKTNFTDKNLEDINGEETTKAMVIETLKALAELGDEYTEHFKDAEDEEADTSADEASEEATAEDEKTKAYNEAANKIVTSIKKELDTQYGKINEEGSTAYVDLSDEETAKSATDLQKWLFGDGREAGDVTVIKTTSTSGSGEDKKETTTYTWYAVTDVMVIDEEKTKDAYYIKLSTDKTSDGTGDEAETTVEDPKSAEEKANAMFAALEADKTVEKFDELAKEYGMTTSTALKESISEKTISATSEELAEWLYDDERKEGDIAKILSGVDYYVAYFVEENEETWKVNARAGVTSDKITAWFEEAVKKYNVEVDTDAPETSAEAATA